MSWWDPNDNIPIEEHDPVKDCIAMGEKITVAMGEKITVEMGEKITVEMVEE